MIAIRESLVSGWARLVAEDKDHSLFGSLGIVAACLFCLTLVFMSGCSQNDGSDMVGTSPSISVIRDVMKH